MNAVTTQTSYSETIAVGLAGQIVNMREGDGITRTCEPATIAFGVAVCQGTDKVHGCTVGGAIGLFLGASYRDITLINTTTANVDKYEVGNNVGICTTGELWVQVSVDVTPADPVHFSATTGIFAKSGGTGPLTNSRWMSNSQNGLARLHLMVV
jgi:hypothetical protein